MEDISNNSQENFKPVLTSPFFEECIQANFSNLDYPKLLNVTKVAQWQKYGIKCTILFLFFAYCSQLSSFFNILLLLPQFKVCQFFKDLYKKNIQWKNVSKRIISFKQKFNLTFLFRQLLKLYMRCQNILLQTDVYFIWYLFFSEQSKIQVPSKYFGQLIEKLYKIFCNFFAIFCKNPLLMRIHGSVALL